MKVVKENEPIQEAIKKKSKTTVFKYTSKQT